MANRTDGLAELLIVRSEFTRSFFSEYADRSFPHEHLSAIADLPGQLIDEMLASLPALTASGASGAARTAGERQLLRLGLLLETVHKTAEFLEASEVLAIPAEMARFAADLIDHVVSGSHLVLRADTEFNYSYSPLGDAINDAISGTGLKARLPESLALFRFPAAYRDDALLQAILAHEIGHFADEHADLTRQVLISAGNAVNQSVEDAMASGLGLDKSQTRDFVVLKQYMSIVPLWIAELLSDLVGVHLLGASFAFAMDEFSRFEQDPSLGSSHPPSLMRRNLVEEEMRFLGWLDEVLEPRSLWEPASPHTARPLDPSWSEDKKLVELAAAQIPNYFASCQKTVRDFCAGKTFLPSDAVKTEGTARSLLQLLVPPAEALSPSPEPFSPESIINACWLFWQEGTPGWDSVGSIYEKRALLSRLLLKALEISRIRSRMK